MPGKAIPSQWLITSTSSVRRAMGISRHFLQSPQTYVEWRKLNMSTLRESFFDELADIYDAEQQLLKALPKMAQAANNESLRAGFETHLRETEGHVARLEQVFQSFGKKTKAKKCKAMKGLIAEGEDLIDED